MKLDSQRFGWSCYEIDGIHGDRGSTDATLRRRNGPLGKTTSSLLGRRLARLAGAMISSRSGPFWWPRAID